jgi:hypothetical protein
MSYRIVLGEAKGQTWRSSDLHQPQTKLGACPPSGPMGGMEKASQKQIDILVENRIIPLLSKKHDVYLCRSSIELSKSSIL